MRTEPVGTRSGLVAHPDQVVGTRLSRVVGGPGDGALILSAWTPAGTEVDLQVDRALDVLSVRHGGVRFGWAGPPGLSARTAYEPAGFGWQRTFYGGLLTTSGLEHVGDPTGPVDGGQRPPGGRPAQYGEHGRIAHAPAAVVERTVDEDAGVIRIRALVSQGAIYDERFELSRTFEVRLDRPEIRVRDEVRNTGPLPARHAILYHLNFGHPVAGPGASIRAGSHSYTTPELQPAADEVVECWNLPADDSGVRTVEIAAADGTRLVRCRQSSSLPHFFTWAVPRSRVNALGLAPSSTSLDGRVDRLQPGATRRYEVSLAFGDTAAVTPSPDSPDRTGSLRGVLW